MDELRELLYSFAQRFTKSPVGAETGSKIVRSTSEGLQITALIDIKKFSVLYSERELDAVLSELEKEFLPDLGVSRTLDSIRLSRFITEGGPWVDEFLPGVRFVFEVGKPIVGQIDRDLAKHSQETDFQSAGQQTEKDGRPNIPPT
jgi:hypothetical protein